MTRRVLAVLGGALALVGVASVAVTHAVLDDADSGAARARAQSALRALEVERSEGDSIDVSMREVLADAEANGVCLAIRPARAASWTLNRSLPEALFAVAPDRCDTAKDLQGEKYRACAAHGDAYDVVAGIAIGAHARVIRTLALVMLFVVALTLLLVAWAVRRAVAGPTAAVGALARWTEEIDLARDTPIPAPSSELEELARLGASFDSLVHRLVAALTRERAHTAYVAHELRTPLTAIVAELEAMTTTAESEPIVSRVRTDVARLSRVIDALLVLARAPETRDQACVLNVADVARELAHAETQVDAPDEALIEGDAALVALAIGNLLDNAQKYSGHPARAMRLTRDGERVAVTVEDDGPGLDAAAREKMFDRYWRGASDRGGIGLGLALVKAVAERHGGEARARTHADGSPGLAVTMTMGPLKAWHEEQGAEGPSSSA